MQSAACDSDAHLNSIDRILSDDYFNKDAVTQTFEGKKTCKHLSCSKYNKTIISSEFRSSNR